MRPVLFLLIFVLLASGTAGAQDSSWTLQRCVQYALAHNLSIKQSVLAQRRLELQLQQSRLSQLPNANVTTGYGRSYGRSIDPTTNQFVSGNYDFLNFNGSADVLVFGWFQKRNMIAANKLNAQAATEDLHQLQDDVSLNVATGFLRALLAKEQILVNEHQVGLSAAQLNQTQKFADAGRVPELDVAQLQSQLASDSARLITAVADYESAILDLKALLNLDFQTPFVPVAPRVADMDVAEIMSHSEEEIFLSAAGRFGAIKSSELKLTAAQKNVAAAQGARWPTLTLGAQWGTNYATTYKEMLGVPTITGSSPTGSFVEVGGNSYPIYQPTFTYQTATIPFNNQFANNFRSTYGLNLNIPIFNGWQNQYQLRQARIGVEEQRISQEQTSLQLRQDVYKAYSDARNSLQKFAAAQRAADAANRAYDFASKRYELGFTNAVEYLTIQNNQYAAEAQLASARYDMIFRLQVLNYYLGRQLNL